MEQASDETASRGPGVHNAFASKQAADARALDLVSTVRERMEAGIVSRRSLANELNRRGLPTAGGARWHRTTVVRMLRRLDLLTSGQDGIDNELMNKRPADARAEVSGPTIRKLRKAGFASVQAIARELNKRGIPTPQGGKWHLTTVSRLLERLDRLDRLSNSRHRRLFLPKSISGSIGDGVHRGSA
jgi:hypothetical protein